MITLPAGRILGPGPCTGPRPARAGSAPPAPARSRGLGPAPPALQCTGALVVSPVVELWDACGMQKRFGTGSRAENKKKIRRNQLEIRINSSIEEKSV
jgi:hypothetical protein